jgi:hypothetical protein
LASRKGRLQVARIFMAGGAVLALLVQDIGTSAAVSPTQGAQIVHGDVFDPRSLESSVGDTGATRAPTTARLKSRPGEVGTGVATDADQLQASQPPRVPSTGDVATTVANGLFSYHLQQSSVSQFDGTGAILGDRTVIATADRIYADYALPRASGLLNWQNSIFFALPKTDWYWGAAVAASIFRGRFVAVLPSFSGPSSSCSTGWLNVAVSSPADPMKPWTRFRISMGDAWSDAINLGLTDDKVALTTNQWDLNAAQSDCLGAPYEGARIRVVDWADLIDGGTLTVRDVTPASATNYYSWVPATNVPVNGATAAGSTVQLIGDKWVGSWGYVVHATVTGSAKAGTAVLAKNEDLTTAGAVSQLFPPPATIAALSTGNGYMDERPLTAAHWNGRLWFSSNASCQLPEDSAPRACARYTLLDTTATPATKIENAFMTELERDTFLPLVGFSRDGTAYFVMSASSAVAHEPIDEYATSRLGGATLVGGEAETMIYHRDQAFNLDYWGSRGSIVPWPGDNRMVMATNQVTAEGYAYNAWATQLGGGLSGTPSGSVYQFGIGTGWVASTNEGAIVRPSTSSPIQAIRVSGSPETEDTTGGPRLVHGKDFHSQARIAAGDLTSPELGGTPGPTVTMYLQWQTQDGTWSTPISVSAGLDTTAPTFAWPTIAFALGVAGKTVPVKLIWTASDTPSGLARFVFDQNDMNGPGSAIVVLGPTATTITRALRLGGRYQLSMSAEDMAGNAAWLSRNFNPTIVAGGSSVTFVKTWSTQSSSNFLGGSTRYATAAGATVAHSFNARAISFITTKGPTRGKVEIWIDGVKQATLDLYAASTKYRQIVYQRSWTTVGPHTIKIRVLGTSGRPRVDFDAFVKG